MLWRTGCTRPFALFHGNRRSRSSGRGGSAGVPRMRCAVPQCLHRLALRLALRRLLKGPLFPAWPLAFELAVRLSREVPAEARPGADAVPAGVGQAAPADVQLLRRPPRAPRCPPSNRPAEPLRVVAALRAPPLHGGSARFAQQSADGALQLGGAACERDGRPRPGLRDRIPARRRVHRFEHRDTRGAGRAPAAGGSRAHGCARRAHAAPHGRLCPGARTPVPRRAGGHGLRARMVRGRTRVSPSMHDAPIRTGWQKHRAYDPRTWCWPGTAPAVDCALQRC